jgi:hypothetical protein
MGPGWQILHSDNATCQKTMELWFDSQERQELVIRLQSVQTGCSLKQTHIDYHSTDTVGSFPAAVKRSESEADKSSPSSPRLGPSKAILPPSHMPSKYAQSKYVFTLLLSYVNKRLMNSYTYAVNCICIHL